MKRMLIVGLAILLSVSFQGCTTGQHGSLTEKTFIDELKYSDFKRLGRASGESCQTRVLYTFPKGDPPTTAEALDMAKNQYKTTAFLADVTVETRIRWTILYSEECVVVTGIAYSAEEKKK